MEALEAVVASQDDAKPLKDFAFIFRQHLLMSVLTEISAFEDMGADRRDFRFLCKPNSSSRGVVDALVRAGVTADFSNEWIPMRSVVSFMELETFLV